MNGIITIGIEADDEPGVGSGAPSEVLLFPNHVGVMIHVIGHRATGAPSCNLDDAKWQVFVLEDFPPIGNDSREGFAEGDPGVAEGIVFALVEEGSANRQSRERHDHGIEGS